MQKLSLHLTKREFSETGYIYSQFFLFVSFILPAIFYYSATQFHWSETAFILAAIFCWLLTLYCTYRVGAPLINSLDDSNISGDMTAAKIGKIGFILVGIGWFPVGAIFLLILANRFIKDGDESVQAIGRCMKKYLSLFFIALIAGVILICIGGMKVLGDMMNGSYEISTGVWWLMAIGAIFAIASEVFFVSSFNEFCRKQGKVEATRTYTVPSRFNLEVSDKVVYVLEALSFIVLMVMMVSPF